MIKLVKTQIRFTDRDLALLTKQRGTEDQLRPLNMKEIEKECALPPIDYNLQWKRRPDRPHFRQISPQNRKISLKSLGGDGSNKKVDKSPDSSPLNKRLKNTAAGTPPAGNQMDVETEDY